MAVGFERVEEGKRGHRRLIEEIKCHGVDVFKSVSWPCSHGGTETAKIPSRYIRNTVNN